jgi:predicted O-methyltransferase YrrM
MFGLKTKPVSVSPVAASPAALPREQLGHFPRLTSEAAHPTKWVFPAYLDNPNCRWLSALKELYANPITFPASLSPEAGLMLHGLIRNQQPRVVVEVGSFCSVSTHWIASALLENGYQPKAPRPNGAQMHCFDDFGPVHKGPWRDVDMLTGRKEFVTERLTKAGLIDFVTLHQGDSSTKLTEARAQLASQGGVDFAFIDGDHGIPGAVADFVAVEPVLNTGGFVLLHDTFPEQCGNHLGPRHILDHVHEFAQGRYEVIDLYLSPLNYGLGLMRRVR